VGYGVVQLSFDLKAQVAEYGPTMLSKLLMAQLSAWNGKPEPVLAKVSQEAFVGMIGAGGYFELVPQAGF